MALAFILSFLFAAAQSWLIYHIVSFIAKHSYAKAFYLFLADFLLCGAGALLFLNFTRYIAVVFSGFLFGFVLSAIGGFIFKQFCPYTVKELWQMLKKLAVFCYKKLRIYIPVAIKFLKEKSLELTEKIKVFIESRRK